MGNVTKIPVNNFEWIEDTSKFNEDLTKSYNEQSDEGYFHKVDINYLEKLHELHNDLPFLPQRMETEKLEESLIYIIKVIILFT